MKKLAALIALVVLVSLAFSGTASYAAGSQIELKAQNGSSEDGTATFTDMGGGKIKIVIDIKNGTAEPQPAHIHKGTCANLDPKPEYPLTSVSDGKSETTLDLSLDDLQKTDYAINIHKSAAAIGTYVSCGDIKGVTMAASGSSASPTSPTSTETTQIPPTATTSSSSTSGSSTTTSGSGNTTSGTTPSSTDSSGNTVSATSGSGTSTTSSGSTTSSNMPVTGVGDDPLPVVLILLSVGLVALFFGRKFTRREPEIL